MEKKKKDKKFIIVIIVMIVYSLIIFLPFAFLFGELIFSDVFDKDKFVINNDGSINLGKDLVIKNEVRGYYDEESKTYYVEGYLVNNTDEEVDYINIEYNVYDSAGNILGSATTYLDNLEAKGTWKFKAKYDDIDANLVNSYKISRIEN